MAKTKVWMVPVLVDRKQVARLEVLAEGAQEAQDKTAEILETVKRWGTDVAVGVPLWIEDK